MYRLEHHGVTKTYACLLIGFSSCTKSSISFPSKSNGYRNLKLATHFGLFYSYACCWETNFKYLEFDLFCHRYYLYMSLVSFRHEQDLETFWFSF